MKTRLTQFVISARILKVCVTIFFTFHSITNERLVLRNDIQGIDNSILELSDSHIVQVLLHGRKCLDILSNTNTLNATIDFLLKTKRFDERFLKVKISQTMASYIFIFQVFLGISQFAF